MVVRLPERSGVLTLTGDLAEATITVRLAPVGVAAIIGAQAHLRVLFDKDIAAHAAAHAALVELLASHALLSWDIADHVGEIPASAEGLQRLAASHVMAIATDWITKVVHPPAPLSQPSGGTAKSRTPRRSRRS